MSPVSHLSGTKIRNFLTKAKVQRSTHILQKLVFGFLVLNLL